MLLVLVFLLIGIAFFLADGFNVPASVSWTPLAWASVIAAAVVYIYQTTDVLR